MLSYVQVTERVGRFSAWNEIFSYVCSSVHDLTVVIKLKNLIIHDRT